MKTIRLLSIAVIQVFLLPVVAAQQASIKDAIRVAITTMQYERIDVQDLSVDTVFALIENSDTLIYEVCFNNRKMVFLSGNKSCVPILGFCIPENNEDYELLNSFEFGNEEMPDGLVWMLNSYVEQIRYCFSNNITNRSCQDEWDRLQVYDESNLLLRNAVSPLLDTKWGQTHSNDTWPLWDEHAYNYYVTNENNDCEGGYCPVGCTAIAMSQIMRKWGEPNEIPSECEQFDWDNMPNKLIKTLNSNYAVERDAVAKLTYDCSQKVGAKYCYGDNCNTIIYYEEMYKVLDALKDDFGYSENMVLKSLSEMSYVEWENMIISDLEDGCPIFYAGYDLNNGGHDFVCDGYTGTQGTQGNLFHFNWGNLGKNNGYFRSKELSPVSYNYSAMQQAIFHIRPTGCWEKTLMQCNRSFSENDSKYYSTRNTFSNNNYNYIVESRAEVQIHAGSEIFLTNGFYAEEGSDCSAEIASCGDSARGMGNRDCPNSNSQSYTVESEASPIKLNIFPIPSNASIVVVGDNLKQIEVTNMLGQQVIKRQSDGAETTIEISNLPTGIYFIGVADENGKRGVQKIIKQ